MSTYSEVSFEETELERSTLELLLLLTTTFSLIRSRLKTIRKMPDIHYTIANRVVMCHLTGAYQVPNVKSSDLVTLISSQTGFLKGRRIGGSIRLIDSVTEHCM